MNTRVHILSGMDLVYKWCDVLYNGLRSIQNYLFLNVFNYRYIQSQLLSVLLFLFLLSSGCHVNWLLGWNQLLWLVLSKSVICPSSWICCRLHCTYHAMHKVAEQHFSFIYNQSANQKNNSICWENKNLLANKFWSARLKMSVANGFSVPLSMNHGSYMVPETIITMKS